jgi:hypothetical protein
MPSIFIWKAELPNHSKKYIRYYSGSNWFLEDNDYSSNSYMYLQQTVIPGCDNDSVITFHVKKMPQDWIGADLLEVNQIPYQLIKSDNYATLEHVGIWMRCTLHHETDNTMENLKQQYDVIMQWKDRKGVDSVAKSNIMSSVHQHASTYHRTTRPTTSSYQKQYHKQYESSPRYNQSIHHIASHASNASNASNASTNSLIDSHAVHQQFQEFLNKFNVHTVLNNGYNNPISIPIVQARQHSMMLKYS